MPRRGIWDNFGPSGRFARVVTPPRAASDTPGQANRRTIAIAPCDSALDEPKRVASIRFPATRHLRNLVSPGVGSG